MSGGVIWIDMLSGGGSLVLRNKVRLGSYSLPKPMDMGLRSCFFMPSAPACLSFLVVHHSGILA